MNKLLALFIFVATSAFVFNGALADENGSKKMGKQQHKEMKKAAKDEGKIYKYNKHSDEGDEEDDEDNHDMDRDKSSKNGLEKQREKKADQEHTEEGKGSEQGQASREEHSRKWWKFWEE